MRIPPLPRPRPGAFATIASCALLCIGPAGGATLVGLNPFGPAGTNVLRIETSQFSVASIGQTSTPTLSGLDFEPGTRVLFASSGTLDGGNLYNIDLLSGVATFVGATGFDLVPGLAFDLDGTLYGSAAFRGNAADRLIRIDPATGSAVQVGTYGNGIAGLDGISVHPATGVLYGVSGNAFDGTPGDIFTINKSTGAASLVGQIRQVGTNAIPAKAVAGLSFDREGNLYASLGKEDGRIISINLDTLSFTYLGDAAAGSVSDLAVIPEEPLLPFEITAIVIEDNGQITLTWNSQPNTSYSIFSSRDLLDFDVEAEDNFESQGDTTTATIENPMPGSSSLYFRIREDQ